jgi:hypothetical protein
MKKALAFLALLALSSPVSAQTQPAQMGITPTTTPEVLQTLDNTQTWVPLGTVNSTTHKFSVVGGGGNSYTDHAALLAAITAAPSPPQPISQQGFSAPGDGGDALYQWNAASYCPLGTSSAPVAADGVVCILPSAQSASVAGRYLLSNDGAVNVLQVGMKPGGFDNSPLVQTLMNAVSPAGYTSPAPEIVFPPALGQATTQYYFSQPFVIARGSRIDCRGGLSLDSAGPVQLIFPPGVDGLIQEWGSLAPDYGFGLSDINGCSIVSLGGGGAAGAVNGSASLTSVNLHNRLAGAPFTMPSSCNPSGGACTVGVNDGIIAISGWQPANNDLAVNTGAYAVASDPVAKTMTLSTPIKNMGLFSGTPVTGVVIWDLPASQKYSIRTMPSYVTTTATSSAYNSTTGDLALTFATAPLGASYPADTCFQLQVYGFSDTAGTDYQQLSGVWYVNNITSAGTVIHLQAPKGLTITSLSGGILYSNAIGLAGNAVCMLSGPRLLKPGDMIWSDAFLFGTTVTQMVNHVAGTPTVHTGGSGYSGASGTMTYNGIACDNGPPVLNVTASGGVITGVTGVANRGNCIRYSPLAGDTHWTAGGGLSGGSGASFDMTFNEIAYVNCLAIENCPETASVIYPVGSAAGQMWTVPTGIIKRTQGNTHSGSITYFGIGIRGDCDPGTSPGTGCNASFDQQNTISNSLVGRMMRGGNAGVSTSMLNVFAYNSIVDEVEAGTIGSTYISEEYNSFEDGSAWNSFVGLCGTQNYSTIYGAYITNIEGGYCMGLNAHGWATLVTPPQRQNPGSMLFIGSIYGGPMPSIGPSSQMAGNWRFSGQSDYSIHANAATVSGNIITLGNVPAITAGMTVTNTTHPSVIPANTTVKSSFSGGVVLSNAVTGAGVQNGDVINFYRGYGNGCTQINAGLDNTTTPLGVSLDCVNFTGISYDGYLNAWYFGSIIMPYGLFAPYAGYNVPSNPPVLKGGLLLGDSDGGNPGIERLLDIGDQPPSYAAWHAPGDIRFAVGGGNLPAPGSVLAWSNTMLARNRINADAPLGSTTITIDACAGWPVGTAVIGETAGSVYGVSVTPKGLGTMASCVGTTLTLQAPSLAAVVNGDILDFVSWRPAAPIANDANGTSWSLGNYLYLAPVALASLPAACPAGQLAMISNGVASPVYNANVGTTTGSSPSPVFCAGNVWKYH